MEILNNSIIKLLVRQGSDLDRKQVILASGEMGFTTDQERLFIGNGYLSGGLIVGNKFKGIAPLVTDGTIAPAIPGDLGYSTQNKLLYTLSANNGDDIADWYPVGGVYSGSRFISVSTANALVLNPLSSYSIDPDALLYPLTLSGGQVALGEVGPYHVSSELLLSPLYLSGGKIALSALPQGYISSSAVSSPLSVVNGILRLSPLSSYSILQEALSSPLYIRNGKIVLGDIPSSLVSTKTISIGDGLTAIVNGLSSLGANISTLTNNITIKSNNVLLNYNALSGTSGFYRNVTTYSSISAGHYRVIFPEINTKFIPIATIVGVDALDYQARVIATSISSCDIKILNAAGASRDANIYLTINY